MVEIVSTVNGGLISVTVDGELWVPISANPPTPEPGPDPGPEPGPTPPPVDGAWPDGWDDFPADTPWDVRTDSVYSEEAHEFLPNLSINDQSGNPAVSDSRAGYDGFALDTFRIACREGPRADGGLITLRYGFIQVRPKAGEGDHADGIQCYGADGGVLMAQTKVLAGDGGATCIFAADDSHGLIDLDTCYFGRIPGVGKPGFLVRVNGDGSDEVKVRHCVFEKDASDGGNVFDANITEWVDNRWDDGSEYPNPQG